LEKKHLIFHNNNNNKDNRENQELAGGAKHCEVM
jgi:hypothetical protein